MEDLEKKVLSLINVKFTKDYGMIIIPEKSKDKFIELANKRKWLPQDWEKWTTFCNHQKAHGLQCKDHYHIPMKVGKDKHPAVVKYLQRNMPKDKNNTKKFVIMWAKSKHHLMSQYVYNKTNKHGHQDWTVQPYEADYLKGKLRYEYPDLYIQYHTETEKFLRRLKRQKARKPEPKNEVDEREYYEGDWYSGPERPLLSESESEEEIIITSSDSDD